MLLPVPVRPSESAFKLPRPVPVLASSDSQDVTPGRLLLLSGDCEPCRGGEPAEFEPEPEVQPRLRARREKELENEPCAVQPLAWTSLKCWSRADWPGALSRLPGPRPLPPSGLALLPKEPASCMLLRRSPIESAGFELLAFMLSRLLVREAPDSRSLRPPLSWTCRPAIVGCVLAERPSPGSESRFDRCKLPDSALRNAKTSSGL
eukprot:2270964-Rhodomonas_salina.1